MTRLKQILACLCTLLLLQSCYLGMREPMEYRPMDQQVTWIDIRLYLSERGEYLTEEEIVACDLRILNDESPQPLEIKYHLRKSFSETTYIAFSAPLPNLNDPHILSTESDDHGGTRTLYRTSFTVLSKGRRLSYSCLLALYITPSLEDPLMRLEHITCGDREYRPIYSPQRPPTIIEIEVTPTSLRPVSQ